MEAEATKPSAEEQLLADAAAEADPARGPPKTEKKKKKDKKSRRKGGLTCECCHPHCASSHVVF
jgi:hypothetical protein